MLQGDDIPGLSDDRRGSLGREGTPPSLHVDHADFSDLYHLYSKGTDNQQHLVVPSKDFFAPFEDEDDQSKAEGVDDDGESSSARVQWSDDQSSSNVTEEKEVVADSKAKSDEGTPLEVTGNVEASNGLEENLHAEDAQSLECHVQEAGEYLIRPYLEPGEKLKFRYNCERVCGLEKRDGIFLIGEQCLYVIENYYIEEKVGCIKEKGEEGDISVIDRALGVQVGSSSDSQDILKQPSGSWIESVPATWPGGRAWAYSGNAWSKEKVLIYTH